MNTMNVNGQNGVATSALKNAVVKAVKMINKAEIGKRGYVMIDEGLRLSFDGARFFKGPKDNFIFNGKIEQKCSNGRYDQVLVEIHYKNLDNEEGLCLNDMINGVLDSILADIDNWIINYYKSESSSKWADGLEMYQNLRNEFFGSILVVDNTEDLNSPDALDNDIESIMEFFGDDYKALNDIENEFFGYHFDIDDDLRDNLLFKRNGTFIDMYYNNMVIINNSVYIRLTDIKNIRDFENALFKLISTLINDNDENDGPDALIGFENASEECDGNMMACVDKYGQVFIDSVLDKYADVVCNTVSEYDLDDTIKYCVRGALDYMEYDPEKKRLVGCSLVPDLCDWDDEDEFCEYFGDTYGFDWDSCKEFYEEYCNDIWHFADEYDGRMEDALRDFEKESVFDKMPYKINYDGEYIGVYIDMDDFVDYIKKNMIFNDSKAQLFKKEDLGLRLYYVLDPDNVDIDKHFKVLKYSWLFYRDLENMLPMVTDVKLYDDGLYFWYKDITDMTIREFFEKHKVDDGWGTYVTADPINNYVDEFLSPDAVKTFFNLVEKDEDWSFYIDEDGDGDLYVSGNEGIYKTYFDDDVPMVQVYSYLMDKMKDEISN